jgi:hypothetical protein
MTKFRKKPIVIEAVKWTGKNFDEVMNFRNEFLGNKVNYENTEEWCLKTGKMPIPTLEGMLTAGDGDYIIKGIKGEFYPCKADIFEKTYTLVDEETVITDQEKIAKLTLALEEIVNPIKFMQDRLQEGERLNGHYAVMLSKDVSYLQRIAETALHS